MQIIVQYLYIYTTKGAFYLWRQEGALFLGPLIMEIRFASNVIVPRILGGPILFLKPILSNDSTQNSNNISDFFCTIMIPVQNWCSFCHIFSIILHAPHTKQMILILDLAQLAMTIISEREARFISTIILVLR